MGAGPVEAVLAVAGAVGLVGLLRRRGARAFVLVAPVLAVAVSVTVSYGNPRFNVTAQPSLAIGVAALAAELFRRVRAGRADCDPVEPDGAVLPDDEAVVEGPDDLTLGRAPAGRGSRP